MTQRDAMRALWRRYGSNHEALIRAYVEMEKRGGVERKRNSHGLDAEQYAHALLRDGLRKGWLE